MIFDFFRNLFRKTTMKTGLATSFATPSDFQAYALAKAQGKSEKEALAIGDNCIGCYGDKTNGSQAYCAIPPEHMIQYWGSVAAAKHQRVLVSCGKRSCVALIGDVMPHLANIRNGAIIDMNPALCRGLGLPCENVLVTVSWSRILDSHSV